MTGPCIVSFITITGAEQVALQVINGGGSHTIRQGLFSSSKVTFKLIVVFHVLV